MFKLAGRSPLRFLLPVGVRKYIVRVFMKHVLNPTGQRVKVHGFTLELGPVSGEGLSLLQAYEEYEPGTQWVFRKLLRPGMNVADLGAHVGFFTLLAAGLVGLAGRVYAFEPHPENFTILKKNISLNQCTNVLAVGKAVSDRSGKVQLWGSQASGGHSIFKSSQSSKEGFEVEVISLDEFLANLGWPPPPPR